MKQLKHGNDQQTIYDLRDRITFILTLILLC
jgi:hypothetical protein